MVYSLNQAGDGPGPWEPSYELAEAGFRLYNYILPTENETARKVRRWLEELRKRSKLIGLEIVVEERSADPRVLISMPWNLIYDERPTKHKPGVPDRQGCGAVAAVLVDPIQPDQRSPGRALAQDAGLEKAPGHRRDQTPTSMRDDERTEAESGQVRGGGRAECESPRWRSWKRRWRKAIPSSFITWATPLQTT